MKNAGLLVVSTVVFGMLSGGFSFTAEAKDAGPDFDGLALVDVNTDLSPANPAEPAEVTKALTAFQSRYKDIAGLFSAKEFRNPGEQKLIDKVKANDTEFLIKIAAAKKAADDNQAAVRLAYSLKAVQVGPDQIPRVYNAAKKAAAALELSDNFHVFIVASSELNAFTYSYDANDFDVILYSPLVDLLDDDALTAVIGHEMGHVKDQVILYKLAMAASFEARNASTPSASHAAYYAGLFDELPASLRDRMQTSALALAADHNAVSAALDSSETDEFSRDAELTADRAGVIATGDADGILKTMAGLIYGSKELLAEMNLKALVEQVRTVLANTNAPTDISALIGVEGNHPFSVLRLVEASDWVQSKAFTEIHDRLIENSFGKELDIFARVVVDYAMLSADYKEYLDKQADTDETLVRLKTKDQYVKRLTRLGQGFNTLGALILNQIGGSALAATGDGLFDQAVVKIKNDDSTALKKVLAPSILAVLKKKAEGTTGEQANEFAAKIKALTDAEAVVEQK